jgi:hypothetical protein
MKSLWTYLRYAIAALILYLTFGLTEHSSPGLPGSGR